MAEHNHKTFAERLIIETAHLLSPLERINTADRVYGLMLDLGWELPGTGLFSEGFPSLVLKIQTLIDNIYQIGYVSSTDDCLSIIDTVKRGIESTIGIITKVDGLREEIETELEGFPRFIAESKITTEEFPKRLLDYLLVIYLQTRQSRLFGILNFLGMVGIKEISATETWEPVPIGSTYALRKVYWKRVPNLFADPLSVASEVYDWDPQKDFKVDLFLSRLEVVLRGFLIPGGLYKQDPDVHNAINTGSTEDRELRIPLYQDGQWPDTYAEAGISIAPLDAVTGPPAKPKGIAIIPYLLGLTEITKDLSEDWHIDLKGSASLDTGLGLLIRPQHNLEINTELFTLPASAVEGRIEFTIRRRGHAKDPHLIFGSAEGSRLGWEGAGASFLAATANNDQELAFELNVEGLTLVIDASQGDEFLQKILSGIKIDTVSDVTIGLSNKDGFYFGGSSALDITIPIHKQLGPVKFETVYISISLDSGIGINLAASIGVEIGPISASVDRIGLEIPIGIPDNRDGNLGPLQVDTPRFKPPTGVDLSIDASGIVGGGFLDFDDANKRYTGDITLNFGEIGLTAIGLITTKMPDGSEGFALLINIGTTFNPPMQLSMGFNLSGVGGLIGVNRSMEIDVLRTGLKNRTLDSILFPDPSTVIANASKIISDLRTVFPPAEERYVVGPMVKIGWGSPTIITADIGIFLEFPNPVRIVLLGQVEAALPEEKKALVVIHLDVLGVLDFAKEELTFQASLYDSRILSFTLFGDSAFLLGWGGDPRFALSLGGFHPKFTPPPPPIVFAGLKRLTLDIGTGSKLQLACRAYLALTPNSLQFGARMDLYASAGGFTAEGHLGFDALLYLSPFSFEVEICGGVHLKYKGLSLFGINLTLLLSGPTPWHARGKAKISLLFFSIKVGFSITWGESEKVTLAPIDAWQPLQDALAAAGNWSSGLPAGRTLVESLRGFEEEAPGMIIVHPAGRIEVRQNVVPLGICLDKAGNAPITGHDLFEIDDLIIDDKSLNPEPVQEFFARGQFEELTRDQKLSVPSFERMKGGVTTAASEMVQIDGGDDVVEYKSVTYESILIKRDSTSELQQLDGEFEWEEAQFIAAAGITRKAIRRAGPRKRFSSLHPRPKVDVHEEAYCIANAEDLTRATLSSELDHENRNMTRMAADQALTAQIELEPEQAEKFIVVPEYEVYEVVA